MKQNEVTYVFQVLKKELEALEMQKVEFDFISKANDEDSPSLIGLNARGTVNDELIEVQFELTSDSTYRAKHEFKNKELEAECSDEADELLWLARDHLIEKITEIRIKTEPQFDATQIVMSKLQENLFDASNAPDGEAFTVKLKK